MPRSATILEVLIASPSDVRPQRDVVEQAVLEWNATHSRETNIVLMPRRWERDVAPDLRAPPQVHINKTIVKTADILIGVFWHRMGTPTTKAPSGTEDEIQEFIRRKRPCLLYFSTRHVPREADRSQLERLHAFEEKMNAIGLTRTFESDSELKNDVNRHLTLVIRGEIARGALSAMPASDMAFSRNLLKYKNDWKRCFDLHKGSYIAYNYTQMSARRGRVSAAPSGPPRPITASLLSFTALTAQGIEFEISNPQYDEVKNQYRIFSYHGFAYPAQDRFIYLFADQDKTEYEVISAVVEFGTVPQPNFLTGYLVCIGVDTERDLFYPGSAGFLLRYLSLKRANVKDLLGKSIGEFAEDALDPGVLARIPKLYYSHRAPDEASALPAPAN